MAQEILLTQEGLNKLEEELQDLKTNRRKQVADAIREAKSHGDLRENAAYHEAKLNQTRLESRIADLDKVLLIAKVVDRPEHSGDVAHLGSKVELKDIAGGFNFMVELVGSFEADPLNDLVSITSPLGSALLGKVVDDHIEIEAPAGIQQYQVLKIS